MCVYVRKKANGFAKVMKNKVQTLEEITFGLKAPLCVLQTPLHVLGGHTGMNTELYQSNVKIQGLPIDGRFHLGV